MGAEELTVEFAAIVDEWLDGRELSPGRVAWTTGPGTLHRDVERLCEIVVSRGAVAATSVTGRRIDVAEAKGRSVVIVHPRRARHGVEDGRLLIETIVDVADAGARLAGIAEIGESGEGDRDTALNPARRGDRHDTSTPGHAAMRAANARILAVATRASTRIDRLDLDGARRALQALEAAAVDLARPVSIAATRLALARCCFWQGEIGRALRIADTIPRRCCRKFDARAQRQRLLALLALGRIAEAGRLLPDLHRLPGGWMALPWCECSIYWRAASGAWSGAGAEFRAGLRASRDCPPWQVRIALAWDAASLRLGERRDPSLLETLLRRHRASLSPLLVSRLLLALGRPAPTFRQRPPPGAAVLSGKCHVMSDVSDGAVLDDVLRVLSIVEAEDDDGVALERVTSHLRERLQATGVVLVDARDHQALLLLGNAGDETRSAAVSALTSGAPTDVIRRGPALVIAVPVFHRGRTVAALGVRWSANATVDESVPTRILTATAAATAAVVHVVIERRSTSTPEASSDGGLVGKGEAMTRLREDIRRAAGAPFHVLVDGESGSGKELVARSIHRLGPRRHRRLCAVNCAALSDDLLEAELFGHARGAFTGAVAERPGLFEEADGGTLFLDEIGELSPRGQAKVLRAIQEQEVRRVGESHPRRVDVRIIAATNRDLAREALEGRFRDDLRYRLDVVHLRVPALRERLEDIPHLTHHFWREAAARVCSRSRSTPRPWPRSRAMIGPATCVSCRTSSRRWPFQRREPAASDRHGCPRPSPGARPAARLSNKRVGASMRTTSAPRWRAPAVVG